MDSPPVDTKQVARVYYGPRINPAPLAPIAQVDAGLLGHLCGSGCTPGRIVRSSARRRESVVNQEHGEYWIHWGAGDSLVQATPAGHCRTAHSANRRQGGTICALVKLAW